MAATATVKVRIEPELSPELEALLGAASADTLEKVNAGAALVYALYHCPAAVVADLPEPVAVALARAQSAYGVGRHRSASDGEG